MSRHAQARGPGVVGQYDHMNTSAIQSCDQCHAPTRIGHVGQMEDEAGLTCRSCHLRADHIIGPSGGRHPEEDSLPLLRREPRMTRGDFCLPCHSLPLSVAVNGRPLLDTWREWAATSYFAQGVQCQDCHMPGAKHALPGAHSRSQVSRALAIVVGDVEQYGSGISLGFNLQNRGAGHHFPTTATPAAIVTVHQGYGEQTISTTGHVWTIARTVHYEDGGWHELSDTRIPAEGQFEGLYRRPIHPKAKWVQFEVWFFPDWHYQGLYERLLKKLGSRSSPNLSKALKAAESSGFLMRRVRRSIKGPSKSQVAREAP